MKYKRNQSAFIDKRIPHKAYACVEIRELFGLRAWLPTVLSTAAVDSVASFDLRGNYTWSIHSRQYRSFWSGL
jgi:hypothetical protein